MHYEVLWRKDVPGDHAHEQNVREGKTWMFMKNNEHFNFNAA